MSLSIINNEIVESKYKSQHIPPIVLEGDEKLDNDNEWQTYHERNSKVEKQCGQAFSMIRGQCMHVLLDKMKHDPDWDNTSESYDPLTLLEIVDTILSSTRIRLLRARCRLTRRHWRVASTVD